MMNLSEFSSRPFAEAAQNFFKTLGYSSRKRRSFSSLEDALEMLPNRNAFKTTQEWKELPFFFQFTSEEINAQGTQSGTENVQESNFKSFFFFALELKGERYPRTELAAIVRDLNKTFSNPCVALLKYGNWLSLGIIDRRPSKRPDDFGRDVLGKVTLIKDINAQSPHRAHLDILHDLSLASLRQTFSIENFDHLHAAWKKTLSISELNKKFYRELSNWYFYAQTQLRIDGASESEKAEFLIRLITRVIFIWFIKEKGLVPESLFQPSIFKLLKQNGDPSRYYRAILQNLFFATLNKPIAERRFKSNTQFQGKSQSYAMFDQFRFADYFAISEKDILELFKPIPFLNGGLFECLDRELSDEEKKHLKKSDSKIKRVDFFTETEAHRLQVPDDLFFMPEKEVDLSRFYGEQKPRKEKTRGLFEILNAYKFTIEENTPIEEELALDPELLGRIFENLLASYNPETEETARNATGSFYTPREIVDYMVDESLLAHFATVTALPESTLRALLSYDPRSAEELGLSEQEIETLINAIDAIRILDPACGSGAFPMGILHKLTHLLQKLDPNNKRWIEKQLEKLPEGKLRDDARQAFEHNRYDYARKLGLIRECIYGVDIQPIAIQIAKLRFFISLVIDQTRQASNRPEENYGIEPLPNLETKFVCANALLGVPKPSHSLIDAQVEKKEEELKALRERYFTAKSRAEKKRLEEKDHALRAELAELLQKSGFQRESAELLAQWNPYSQTDSAPFFDPEWMFGIRDGFHIVIGNPPYIRQEKIAYKASLRHYKVYKGTADLLCYFYEAGYNFLAPKGILALITSNKYLRAGYGDKLRQFLKENFAIRQLIDFGDLPVFEALAYPSIFIGQKCAPRGNAFRGITIKTEQELERFAECFAESAITIAQASLDPKAWRIETEFAAQLLQKLRQNAIPLGEYVQGKFYYGIKTGYNKAFVIDEATKNKLIAEDPKSAEIIKPFLRGKDIKRYQIHDPHLYLIYIPHRWTNDNRGKIEPERFIKEAYPAVFQHLKRYEMQLRERDDQGEYWWEMRPCKYLAEFEKPKIIYPDIAKRCEFTYDSAKYFLGNTAYLIPTCDLFLLGYLNSSVCNYLYSQISNKIQNDFLRFIATYMEHLPIPRASEEAERAIAERVEKILAAKSRGEDTSALEREIDELVYGLYGLMEEEIRVVEGAA